ncbi:hypothetical protein [Pseudomonas syringae]|uniref:Uncharacterized protein n=1 Tax=Pseudomonas syringae TaxID=317 RepID=A0A085VEP5_PSESX|nr:hypothetical protein [Pseudomonas syringae]KFE53908.1 hypothetical protein IV01_17865 [Pseudomonas syringae]
MKHSKERLSPSTTLSKDRSKQSLAPPYISEMPIGSDRLPIAVANGGFSVVVPAFSDRSFNRVLIYLVSGTDVAYPIPIKDAFPQTGVDTTLTYTSADVDNHFKVNDTVKIHNHYWYVDEERWTHGPASMVYTVVA